MGTNMRFGGINLRSLERLQSPIHTGFFRACTPVESKVMAADEVQADLLKKQEGITKMIERLNELDLTSLRETGQEKVFENLNFLEELHAAHMEYMEKSEALWLTSQMILVRRNVIAEKQNEF